MDYIEVLKNSRLKDIVWLHTSDIWGSVVFKVSIIDWSCNCIFESISHLFVRKQNKCKNSSRECKQIHIKHLNLVSNIYTTLCIESYKTPRPTRFGKVACLYLEVLLHFENRHYVILCSSRQIVACQAGSKFTPITWLTL